MKITKSKEWYYRASIATAILAWIFCIVPTLIAGIIKLPIIATKSAENTLTGSFTIVLICCAYPLFKGLLKMLKSPSAWLILWIVTGITFLLYNISHETLGAMLIVFFVAALGNSIGAILFFLSRVFNEKYKFCGQVQIVGGKGQ